ncbi:MAG: mechanosensitive ion channel [Zavarzinella sp.]
MISQLEAFFRPLVPTLFVVAIIVVLFIGLRWLFLRKSLVLEQEKRLPRQLGLAGFAFFGIIATILALPITSEIRNQLFTVLGLLASGIIALASTTIVSNAMAGLMLRSTRCFRTGDYIRVKEHFGRVTQRGLLDTEIQTEDRELTMLPNLFLITNPVTVVRTSGTLVSTSLTLGYDTHHEKLCKLLEDAAHEAELTDPFVRIMELGNFAVTYRVSGFLDDIKNLLTARSNLCKKILDVLHAAGVEIMSPTIMNQRQTTMETKFVPADAVEHHAESGKKQIEEMMFDKAEQAEKIEATQQSLEKEIKELEEQIKEGSNDDHTALKERLKSQKAKLKIVIDAKEKKD